MRFINHNWGTCAALMGGLACCSSVARSQPPQRDTGDVSAQSAQVERDWKQLLRDHKIQEAQSPVDAIAAYQHFYEQSGFHSEDASVEITSRIALLYWRALNQPKKAQDIYDWGITKMADYPGVDRLRRERTMLLKAAPVPVPAQVGAPGPVPAGNTVPAQAGVPNTAAPAGKTFGVDGRTLVAASLAAQLQAGGDPEALWQTGTYTAADLIYALSSPGVITPGIPGTKARVVMAGLLARHASDKLPAPDAMNRALKLALADYYASVKDEHAVALYEALLQERKAHGGPRPVEIDELTGLSGYYQAIGQKDKAAEVLLRAPEFSTTPFVLGGDALSAARLYSAAGLKDKAQLAYEQAERSGSGWMTGVALLDQAGQLSAKGQEEEARKLLERPVQGQEAEQIAPLLRMMVGESYFRGAELENARQSLQQAITMYQALKNPMPGVGLEGVFGATGEASQDLKRVEGWIKEPIQVEPRELTILVDEKQPLNQPITQRVHVRLYQDLALVVTVSAPGVQARVVDYKNWQGYQDMSKKNKEIEVEITQDAARKGLECTLTISSPQIEKFQVQVPVKVQTAQ